MAPPGWDGDDLAGQMEDALERAAEREDKSPASHLSADDHAMATRRESLRLSHARTVDQLTRATNPAHRQMLERALQALEAELNKV